MLSYCYCCYYCYLFFQQPSQTISLVLLMLHLLQRRPRKQRRWLRCYKISSAVKVSWLVGVPRRRTNFVEDRPVPASLLPQFLLDRTPLSSLRTSKPSPLWRSPKQIHPTLYESRIEKGDWKQKLLEIFFLSAIGSLSPCTSDLFWKIFEKDFYLIDLILIERLWLHTWIVRQLKKMNERINWLHI